MSASTLPLSKTLKRVMEAAAAAASRRGQKSVRTTDLLLALAEDSFSSSKLVLQALGVEARSIGCKISELRR